MRKYSKHLYYIFLEFSSVEACFQEEAYSEGYLTPLELITGEKLTNKLIIKENEKRIIEANLQSKNFFIWGFTDILRLFIFDNFKGFTELQKLKPPTNVDDLKYCAGFCYTNKLIDLEKILRKHPLLGISFLKFKDSFFKYVKIRKYDSFIFKFLKDKIKEVAKGRENTYCVIPIISYGWEDVILLFFSKSYDLIKKAILGVRQIKSENIKDFLESKSGTKSKIDFTHIFMTTFTIFGTYFPDYYPGEIKKSVDKLKNTISKNDKAYISGIKFQVRPGHEKKLTEELNSRLPQGKLEVKPAPYRGDICLNFKTPTNFHRFLDYYPTIIEIIEMKNKNK
ncbi:hypothetical protein J7L36_02145, partial [bacterium]|nr:hypothetical protein [bacterium]